MNTRATIYALLAVLAWSTVATAFKIALRHLDQFQLLFLAIAFSTLAVGLVLVAGGRWKHFRTTSRRQYRDAALLGILNPVVYYLILLKAYALLPAQIAQPLNYTWALTLGLLSVPLLKQRLTKRDIVGGLVCYFGVVVISTGGNLTEFSIASPLGVGLALGSTIIWAFYWLGNTRLTQGEKGMDPVVALFVGFAFSLPVVALINFFASDFVFTSAGIRAAAYIGAVEMGFTFVLWLTAMRLTTSTAKIANLIFLSPFLSLIFIHFILGEHVVPGTIVGLVFIVGGLLWQSGGSVSRQ